MKICIFERSNEKNHISKTKIYFNKKNTPQLLEHIGLQNMKVRGKTNFGQLAAVCLMHADISSWYFCSQKRDVQWNHQREKQSYRNHINNMYSACILFFSNFLVFRYHNMLHISSLSFLTSRIIAINLIPIKFFSKKNIWLLVVSREKNIFKSFRVLERLKATP